MRADILLIARIFPRPCGARKNTTQLAKYPHVLYAKPSNKVYILIPNSSLLEKQTLAQTKVANPTPSFLFLFYNTPIYPVNLSVGNEVLNNNNNSSNNKNQAHFSVCSLFISRRRLYFPSPSLIQQMRSQRPIMVKL